ncbi:tetratricopeptide repeat protein [Blastomonas sp. AAP53]|uniref:surface lipoprotein assembly modifier n=1 Tax=Blastomonas sp. AAP53 TaxID=1248760 RepID=UPI000300759A|nr:tetratricopeptide repeat protein [Blastomonas sp. AAP53]
MRISNVITASAVALNVLAYAALTPPAAAQSESDLRQAMEQLKAGQAEAAYATLKGLEAQGAGNQDYDLALGLAALESGRHGEAIIAFQRILAQNPGNARAQAELARTYAAAGDIDTARAEFDTVRGDPSIPDPVRNRIDGLVRNIDRQIAGGAAELTGYVDFEGGRDSNINTATDATSVTLPLFAFLGPANLNGAARQQDAGFYQIQAGISGSLPLGRQTRLFASALGNWRDNIDSRFVDQASVVGTVGIAHSLANGDVISGSAQGQRFWLGRNGFRTSTGGDLRYTKKLASDRALSVSGQFFRLNFDGNPLLDADRFSGSITYADKAVFGGIGGGKEETRRAGADQFSFAFVNAQLGGELDLADKAALIGGVSIEHRDYDARDPLFLTGRRDTQYDVSLGVRYRFTETLSVRPRVTYTRNDSNLALYDYDRWTASIGARFSF